jgi:hypothetical protein
VRGAGSDVHVGAAADADGASAVAQLLDEREAGLRVGVLEEDAGRAVERPRL